MNITSNDSDGIAVKVSAIREEIERVIGEIEWNTKAPLPLDEIKTKLAAAIKVMGERYALPIGRLMNPEAGSRELEEILTIHGKTSLSGPGGYVGVDMPLAGFLAATLGDDLIKRLNKQIDALDYTPGPPTKERPGALKTLRAALHELEVREESLICAAENIGLYISRRHDASPEIILGYDPNGQTPDIRRHLGGTSVSIPASST